MSQFQENKVYHKTKIDSTDAIKFFECNNGTKSSLLSTKSYVTPRKPVAFTEAAPPRWNPLWRGEGAYSN